MATHGHIARFVVKSGRRAEAAEILKPMLRQVLDEPGTLLYLMHESLSEPDVIWFYERYADEAAFKRHMESAVHHYVVAKLMPLLDPATKVHWLELVGAKKFA